MRVCTAGKDSLYVRSEVREVYKDQHEETKGQAEAGTGEPQSDSHRDSLCGTRQGKRDSPSHLGWISHFGNPESCVIRPCRRYCVPVVTEGSYSTTEDDFITLST